MSNHWKAAQTGSGAGCRVPLAVQMPLGTPTHPTSPSSDPAQEQAAETIQQLKKPRFHRHTRPRALPQSCAGHRGDEGTDFSAGVSCWAHTWTWLACLRPLPVQVRGAWTPCQPFCGVFKAVSGLRRIMARLTLWAAPAAVSHSQTSCLGQKAPWLPSWEPLIKASNTTMFPPKAFSFTFSRFPTL